MIHKARYLIPGAILPEETTRVLSERSVEAAVAVAPRSAYCFTFYDVAEPVPLPPAMLQQFDVTPKQQNKSGRYYLGGQVFTRPELRAWIDANGGDKAHHALYANAEGNGWDRMIRCRPGNWQPFTDDDELVEMDA